MDTFGISNITWMIILVLIFYVGGILIFLLSLCMASQRGDREIDRALAEMKEAENTTWKYDLTETTTSGCPINCEK